jgi:hypothetical protein
MDTTLRNPTTESILKRLQTRELRRAKVIALTVSEAQINLYFMN